MIHNILFPVSQPINSRSCTLKKQNQLRVNKVTWIPTAVYNSSSKKKCIIKETGTFVVAVIRPDRPKWKIRALMKVRTCVLVIDNGWQSQFSCWCVLLIQLGLTHTHTHRRVKSRFSCSAYVLMIEKVKIEEIKPTVWVKQNLLHSNQSCQFYFTLISLTL